MSFCIGVIYPDNKGNKWIVLDRYNAVLLVSKIEERCTNRLAVDMDGYIAPIRGKGDYVLQSKHITGGIL